MDISSFCIVSKIKKNSEYKNHINNVIKIPLIYENLYFKNLSFNYIKNFNFSDKNKIIPKFFNSSSSSLIRNPMFDDRYILNVRCINYSLNMFGHSTIVQDRDICLTSNVIIILDSNFNILFQTIFHPEIINSPYIGIEDIRLFKFNKKIFYIGSSYDILTKTVKITSYEYTLFNDYKLNFITPTFKTSFNWEKNWVFFENDNEMFIIYKWSPIYVCKIDYTNNTLNLYKSIDVPDIFYNFRGSTNGVLFDNKIWFIVHSQNTINAKKHYYHRFVVLNTDLTLYGYSKMFKFENYLIEFCIGFELSVRNNFIITYSTLDKKTKLAVFSPQTIEKLLTL
jgi:hypothetical protein